MRACVRACTHTFISLNESVYPSPCLAEREMTTWRVATTTGELVNRDQVNADGTTRFNY